MHTDIDSIGVIGEPADAVTAAEVQAFLFHEAALIDDKRFEEWLELFDEDLEYRLPVRIWRDEASHQVDPTACLINDDKQQLSIRVQRIHTGYAWAESPPSVTRHFVSNLRVSKGPGEDEVSARASILVTRSRGPRVAQEMFPGDRFDILRRVNDSYLIARRTVILDTTNASAQNLAIFF